MRSLKWVVFALALWASLAGATDVQQQYNAEEARILEQMSQGKISQVEAMLEVEAAGKVYFPGDELLHARNASFVRYAQQAERGEIAHDRMIELIALRMQRFEDAAVARSQARANELESARRAAQASEEAERRSQFIGNMLRNLGTSMQRSNPPGVNCTSQVIGGQVVTNCR